MNIFALRNLRPKVVQILHRCPLSTEFYPYTTELYRKNYIKYPVQSRQAILHDYFFHEDERLPCLEERLKEFRDPEELNGKQIGHLWKFPKIKEFKKEIGNKIEENKSSKQLELDSKEMRIDLPLDNVNQQNKVISAFKNVQVAAEHYGIFKDLFNHDYFKPVVDLKIDYDSKLVYYGNKLNAQDTKNAPSVNIEDTLKFYETKNDKVYHTLVFMNLDGNFNTNENQVLLWFNSNIKNKEIGSGNEQVKYLQPFPMRGTGWHRCVYVLFEHKSEIDFDLQLKNATTNSKFNERNFSFSNFFKAYSNDLVPVGLSFFQTEWDLSVKSVFYDYFDLKEPVYEFDFETKFVPRMEKYPKDIQPFNWYIQEYMDKKEINEQVMKDYLKMLSPFSDAPEPAKYPLIDLKREGPRWYKFEAENVRKRRHQYSQIPFKYFSPTNSIREQIKNLPFQQEK